MYRSQEFFKSASLEKETRDLHALISVKPNVSQAKQFMFFCTTFEADFFQNFKIQMIKLFY
jgi:hypothetical protein